MDSRFRMAPDPPLVPPPHAANSQVPRLPPPQIFNSALSIRPSFSGRNPPGASQRSSPLSLLLRRSAEQPSPSPTRPLRSPLPPSPSSAFLLRSRCKWWGAGSRAVTSFALRLARGRCRAAGSLQEAEESRDGVRACVRACVSGGRGRGSSSLSSRRASRLPEQSSPRTRGCVVLLLAGLAFPSFVPWNTGLSLCIMGVSRGCLLCVKVKMFVFNLIFWLGGCGVLGVGIWLAATQGRFATLSFSFPSLSAAGLFMATGAIIMVVGFLGCLGAATEHRCLLMTFFLVLFTLFLLELVGLLVFFTCRNKFDQYAQSNLKEGLRLYGTEDNVGLTKAWDLAQNEFRCCGVRNYTDWFEVQNGTWVPESCCLQQSDGCQRDSASWWKEPCYEKVKRWLAENIFAMGIFAACIIVVQVLGIVFSMLMYCQVRRVEKYYD